MTENEFEKRFMAEMSEQQNTAVKAVQGAVLLLAVPGSYVEVISACVSQAEGIVLLFFYDLRQLLRRLIGTYDGKFQIPQFFCLFFTAACNRIDPRQKDSHHSHKA